MYIALHDACNENRISTYNALRACVLGKLPFQIIGREEIYVDNKVASKMTRLIKPRKKVEVSE